MEVGGNLKVIVRVRSTLPKDDDCIVDVNEPEGQVIVGLDKSFAFDSCFDRDASQDRVYLESVAPVICSFVNKQDNASILAYGQTGAGKTYTMFGKNELDGLVPQTIKDIFRLVDLTEVSVRISFFEIYKEKAYDLLGNSNKRMQLYLRDEGSHFQLTGLKATEVQNFEEAFAIMSEGLRTRAAASNVCNELSSRSHAIFKITLSMLNQQCGLKSEAVLNLVDLAGSESVHRTQAVGVQLTEGNSINKGLLALGGCIRSISEKKSHIPYRDSTLTRVLKECLQGEGLTTFIACVSPSSGDVSETLSTLRYADSAKNLKKPPVPVTFQAQMAQKRRLEMLCAPTPSRMNSNLTLPSPTPRSLPRQQCTKRLNCSTPSNFRSPAVGGFVTSTGYRGLPIKRPALAALEESDDLFDTSSLSDQASMRGGPSTSSVISGRNGSSVKDYFSQSQTITVNASTFSPILKQMESLIRATIAEELRRSPRINRSQKYPESAFDSSSNQTILAAEAKTSLHPNYQPEKTLESKSAASQSIVLKRKSRRFNDKESSSPNLRSADKENLYSPPISVLAEKLGIDLNSPAPTFPPLSERSPNIRAVTNRRSTRRSTMMGRDLRKSLQESGFKNGRRRSARLTLMTEKTKNPLEMDTNWDVKDQDRHNCHILGLINSANMAMLQRMPAIGPKTAYLIFSHRMRHGLFKDLRDLESIPGVQKQFFNKLCLAHQLKF